jgi:hypothetical protein
VKGGGAVCPVCEPYRFEYPGENVYVGTYDGSPKSAWGKAREDARRRYLPLCLYEVHEVGRAAQKRTPA